MGIPTRGAHTTKKGRYGGTSKTHGIRGHQNSDEALKKTADVPQGIKEHPKGHPFEASGPFCLNSNCSITLSSILQPFMISLKDQQQEEEEDGAFADQAPCSHAAAATLHANPAITQEGACFFSL